MPALREEHPGNVTLPVYLGDALQWNLARSGQQGKQRDFFASDETLAIVVPAITVPGKPRPHRFDSVTLLFPAAVASIAPLFDRVLNAMIELGARSEPPENFAAWMEREAPTSTEDRHVLLDTYMVMHRLQTEGRNHIWGYVVRNLARPVWLASETQKADIVIGNPPWLAYRHMKGDLQDKYKAEARSAKVWWTGRGTSANDLSAYFYLRTALLYMRRKGRIALVMPYAAMSRKPMRRSARERSSSSGRLPSAFASRHRGYLGRRYSRSFRCRVAFCSPMFTTAHWSRRYPRKCRRSPGHFQDGMPMNRKQM